MKYLLFFLTLPAIASVQVGDCIDVPNAKPTDFSVAKVDEVRATTYLATSVYHNVQHVLRKSVGYVEVSCPSPAQIESVIEIGRKMKEEAEIR